MGDSLNDDLELIRSLSYYESVERLCCQSPARDGGVVIKNTNAPSSAKYGTTFLDPEELGDDFFTIPMEDTMEYEATEESPEEVSQSSTHNMERITQLEAEVKLLKAQNAQLMVNSCVLYNTLMQHIDKLHAELQQIHTAAHEPQH